MHTRSLKARAPSTAAPGTTAARRASGGFTLVETLVALLVLSVGMIGVAALHGQSLSAGREALFRTVAINLTADMADRIRVNRLGGIAYEGPAANHQCDPETGGGVDCTPAEMAEHDLFIWEQQVANALPNGEWDIDFDNAMDPPTYAITVRWDEVSQQAPVEHTITLQMPTF
jgi:type IV pilus assembly protein PilV